MIEGTLSMQTRSWLRTMQKGQDMLVSACAVIATLSFMALAVLTVVDVFTRNLGVGTFRWALEGSEYLLMIGCFIGAPWVLRRGGHIAIDVVVQVLPKSGQGVVVRAADVVGLLICLPLTVLSVEAMLRTQASGALVFKTLIFPEWYLLLPLVISCVLMSVEFALRCAGSREVAA